MSREGWFIASRCDARVKLPPPPPSGFGSPTVRSTRPELGASGGGGGDGGRACAASVARVVRTGDGLASLTLAEVGRFVSGQTVPLVTTTSDRSCDRVAYGDIFPLVTTTSGRLTAWRVNFKRVVV